MTYADLTFPRPRVLKLLELTDNRFGADMRFAFADRHAVLVRFGGLFRRYVRRAA